MVKYSTISLTKELYDVLQNTIDKNPQFGYNSVADFCKEAIRLHVQEIKREIREDFWRKLDVKDLLKKIDMAAACDGSVYERAFRNIKDMAFILSKDFKIKNVNDSFVSLLGYEREEIFDFPIKNLIEKGEDFIKKLKKERYVRDFETRIKRKDGKKLDILITSNGMKEDYFGVAKDITVKKIVEDRNKKLKELYEYIINSLYNTVIVIQNGKIKFVNSSATVSGYTPEELIGKKVDSLVVEEDKEKILKKMEEKLKGEEEGKPTYYRIKRKDGKIIKIEAISKKIEWEGKPALLTCISVIDNK